MTEQAVPKRLRFEVMRRDGFTCRYCGTPAPETGAGLTVDHVIPRSLGGTNDPSNLVAACQDCNAGKSSSSPDEVVVADVSADSLRWAAAMRLAHEQASVDLHAHDADIRAFGRAWKAAGLAPPAGGWEESVRRFLVQGMSRADLLHFVPIVANRKIRERDQFRYWCGCVINEHEKRVTIAAESLGGGSGAQGGHDFAEWYDVGSALSALMVGPRDLADALAGVLSTDTHQSPTPGRLVKNLMDGAHDKFGVRYESSPDSELNVAGWLASTAGAHASFLVA